MTTKELADSIEEIQKLTPMPGDFIIVRVKEMASPELLDSLAKTLQSIFVNEHRILIVENTMDISTAFGKCLHCGEEVNPSGV